MSADNIIYVIPFKREDGEVVYRVCEVRLSGEEYELLDVMKNGTFKEFNGPNGYNQALGAALILERELQIVEYGVCDYADEHSPVDLQHFEDKVRVSNKMYSSND